MKHNKQNRRDKSRENKKRDIERRKARNDKNARIYLELDDKNQ